MPIGYTDVDCLILAGGLGERLQPLTLTTPKPLLRFAAVHTLIDFTLANVIHSGIPNAYVLSQYRRAQVGRHLRNYVSASPATTILNQPPVSGKHYRGTADAVAQNLGLIESESDLALILSADHVYRMDYRKLIDYAERRAFGVTVACVPVPAGEARRYGIVTVDPRGSILEFREKPDGFASPFPGPQARASMGVYVFRKEILRYALGELSTCAGLDIGRHLLPLLTRLGLAGAYDVAEEEQLTFWRDVGTLAGYHHAHMELLSAPRLAEEVLDSSWLSGCGEVSLHFRCDETSPVSDSIVASSAFLGECRLRRSVIAPHVVIEDGADLEECVVLPGARVSRSARMRRVILDAGVRVGAGDCLGGDARSVMIVSDHWGAGPVPTGSRGETRGSLAR